MKKIVKFILVKLLNTTWFGYKIYIKIQRRLSNENK